MVYIACTTISATTELLAVYDFLYACRCSNGYPHDDAADDDVDCDNDVEEEEVVKELEMKTRTR